MCCKLNRSAECAAIMFKGLECVAHVLKDVGCIAYVFYGLSSVQTCLNLGTGFHPNRHFPTGFRILLCSFRTHLCVCSYEDAVHFKSKFLTFSFHRFLFAGLVSMEDSVKTV